MSSEDFYGKTYGKDFDKSLYDLPEIKFRRKKVVRMVGRNKRVLDLGCSLGNISKGLLANRNEVYGIDVAKESVDFCKKLGIKAKVHNVEEGKMPYKDDFFDVVVFSEVVEHLFNTDHAIREIYRVLKKGGYLIITTPNIAALNRRLKLFLGLNPGIDLGIESSGDERAIGHIRYFTFDSLKKLLRRNGLRVVHMSSDVIMLNRLRMYEMAKIFPRFGYTIYLKARK